MDIAITDKDVEKRLDQIKKQYFGGDQKKYEQQLKAQGLTDAQVRADVRAQLIEQRLYNSVTKSIKVTDTDVQKYYDEHKEQYGTPEQRDVRHILVKTRAEADRIYNQLQAGGDFAALAKQHSQDPGSKDNGGKLTVSKGQTVAPFDQTAFLLSTNRISRPVKTQYGYHIIQPISAVKPAKDPAAQQAARGSDPHAAGADEEGRGDDQVGQGPRQPVRGQGLLRSRLHSGRECRPQSGTSSTGK